MNEESVKFMGLCEDVRKIAREKFFWDAQCSGADAPLFDINSLIDLRELSNIAEKVHSDKMLCVTFISEEFLDIGLHWCATVKKLGKTNYIVFAGDIVTQRALRSIGVHVIDVMLKVHEFTSSYLSPAGFSAKALAMTALKFPVVKALLVMKYNVTLSDADAFWLKDPISSLPTDVQVAFQRVVYFPAPVVKIWGFAACTGFVMFRSKPSVISLLDNCIAEQRLVHSDQYAFNIALLESCVDWEPTMSVTDRFEDVQSLFNAYATFSIRGFSRRYKFHVCALPHDKFWRHEFVGKDLNQIIIAHPNSPKQPEAKLRLLEEFLNLNRDN